MNEQVPQPTPLDLEPEPSSFKLIFTLGLVGLLSGLILAGAYLYTLPIIEANKAAALQRAVYEVLPGCAEFQTLELRDGRLLPPPETEGSGEQSDPAPRIFAGFTADGQLIGFAIQAQQAGFQDQILGIFGYRPEQQLIVGFEVLESKETPGLGDKIMKDPAFIANFSALAVEPLPKLVKKGEKAQPHQVEAITGATISSRAVVRLLENGLEQWREPIRNYLSTQNAKDE